MSEFEITFLMTELDKQKHEIKDLEYQNTILRKQIDEIYKSWLFDSGRYTELKEKYNELKKEKELKTKTTYDC